MSDSSQEDAPDGAAGAGERHASWLELFFDLVAVAGIGMLAHLLHDDPSAHGLALYTVAFTAFWLIWACFTTYADLLADRARTITMVAGMGAMAVMVAAVPEIDGEHAGAFAGAFVVARLVVARPWRRGTIVVDLPAVQAGIGVLPWVVSLWFTGSTRTSLWALGLGVDLVTLLTANRERLEAMGQQRLDRVRERMQRGPRSDRPTRGRRGRGAAADLELSLLGTDAAHLSERLSLFVLIVLGESLIQALDGASEATWDRALLVAGSGAFALVFALWGLSVRHGHAGVALLAGLSPRGSWLAHLVVTGAIAAMASVVATLTGDPHAAVPAHARTLLTAGYLVYACVAVVAHGVRRDWRTAAAVGVPFGLAGLVALLHRDGSAPALLWTLAAGALLTAFGASVVRRRAARPGSGGSLDAESSA